MVQANCCEDDTRWNAGVLVGWPSIRKVPASCQCSIEGANIAGQLHRFAIDVELGEILLPLV